MMSKEHLLFNKLASIEERLERLEKTMYKMDKHIDFIEVQYARLRGPLDWLVASFSTPLSYISRAKSLLY